MIVANSSPIIILGKQGMIELFEKCLRKVIISKSVYEEVMQRKDSPEAIALNRAIKSGRITVQKVAIIPTLDTKNIGQGEKEAISLAYKHKSLLIVDDDSAKKYASIFRVEAHGTLYVIYLAYARRLIDRTTSINILEGMISEGFYVSSELYSKFLDLLGKLEDD